MASQIAPVFALLVSVAFLLMANGMHSLLLPIRGNLEGFSTTELGLLGTGWAAGFVLGCLSAPAVVRRVGHIRAFGASASAASIIALLNVMEVQAAAWIGLRALSGFFLAGAFTVIESWLNERATNESRGSIFAIYMTVTYTALMSGQFLVAAGDAGEAEPFMLCAILFSLALFPTSLSTSAAPRPLTKVSLNLPRLFDMSPVAVVTVALVGVVNGAFGTLAPVYGAQVGLSTGFIAVLMGTTIVAGAVTQLPAGRLSDYTDRRYVLAALALCAAGAGLTLFSLAPRDPTTLLTLVGAYGALTYPLYSLAVAQANDYARPEEFVAVSGGLLLLYGIGTIVGPLCASVAMDRLGPGGLFGVTASAHILIAAWALFRTSRRAPIAEDLRDAYQVAPSPPASTPQAVALDPRGEVTPRSLDDAPDPD